MRNDPLAHQMKITARKMEKLALHLHERGYVDRAAEMDGAAQMLRQWRVEFLEETSGSETSSHEGE